MQWEQQLPVLGAHLGEATLPLWHHCAVPFLRTRVETNAEGSQARCQLFAVLPSKSQAPVHWCNYPFETYLHHPQHDETLLQRTSVYSHHSMSLKNGVLKFSRTAWDKTCMLCAIGCAGDLDRNLMVPGTHEGRLLILL